MRHRAVAKLNAQRRNALPIFPITRGLCTAPLRGAAHSFCGHRPSRPSQDRPERID